MAQDALNELLGRAAVFTARKKVLFEEIRNLTSVQSGLLAPEKVEELLAVVEKKQDCTNEIKKIDAEILRLEERIRNAEGTPARKDVSNTFNEQWREVEKLRQEINFILHETQVLDEQNRQRIQEKYRKLKVDMESLRARRGSVKAYQGSAFQSGGYFIDRKK